MIDNIAILITGNPVSSSGVRSIGGIGTGLTVIDPKWPSMAQGNLALIITDKGQSSNYCLIFPSRLISSSGANREGVLNIQLQLPHGKMLADAEGKMVSPFTLMEEVFNHYKQHHLTQYPGVEGWNFAKDWEMKPEEFAELLAPYKLIDRMLPSRHLSGTGEAFIAMPPDKMALFTLDHAYPELVNYGKVILSTIGMTNPPGLARLEIPRRPMFEIYVNGKKQNKFIREEGEAFDMDVTPPNPSYQLPATIKVDFEKAVADGKVDRANERINYDVKFKDQEQNWKIKIILKGMEGESNRDQVMNELLKAVYLENRVAEVYQPADRIEPNGRFSNPLEFTLKGKQILSSWELKWDKLPENVYKDEVKSLNNGFEVTFSYKKPQSNNGRRRDEQNRTDTTVQKKEVEVIPVYIAAEDTKDGKLTDEAQGIKFDMTFVIDVEKDVNLFTYYGIRCNSDEAKTQKLGNKDYSCYEGKVEMPMALWNDWIAYSKRGIEVKSYDQRYKLEAESYKGTKNGGKPYIAVYASRTSKGAMFLHQWGFLLKTLIVLLILGSCAFLGAYIENNRDLLPNPKTAVAPNVPQETPDPVVEIGDNGRVYINNEIEVTIGENGHWFIDGNDMGRTPNNGIAAEKTPTGNADRDAGNDPAPARSDNVDYAALNAQSARYMELIRKAEMSFTQVDEIKEWVDKNEAHSNGIKDYSKIKTAIGEYVKCRDLLYKVKKGADFEEIAKEFKGTVPKIKSNGDYRNLLVSLRVKMQKFTGGNKLGEEGIEEKLYLFAEDHPVGINSFADLPK